MKLNIKFLKNIGKMLIIGFLIIYCIYILYFFNSNNNFVEGFGQDCSKCEMKPTSGACITIQDLSHNDYGDDIQNMDISFIDTSYVFCPWEPNCTGDAYLPNKSDGTINDITCCSGNTDSWYNTNTINYSSISLVQNLNTKCNQINTDVNNANKDFEVFNPETHGERYYKFRSVCNKPDFKGMLFEKNIEGSGNILTDPNLSVQEILDYQNILEVSMNEIEDSDGKNSRDKIASENEKLRKLNPDISGYDEKKLAIQNTLAGLFVSTISYETYNYQLLNKNLGNVTGDYLLNGSEFLDCFGKKQDYSDKSFSQDDLKDFSDNAGQYFDVDDPKITTIEDNKQRPYPNDLDQDLKMELKRLEQIQPGGTAPVSVINQYLTAINGFYEKQMTNMLGTKTHAVNDQLVFENDTLDTKSSTFFVYETDPNNEYECQPSITGNDKFKYCGPDAYYTEFKQ